MVYVCTERPYPSVQVLSPIVNAVFAFGGGGRLDTLELAQVRHLPFEMIDQAIEAMPEFKGKGPKRTGRTVFRLDEIEKPTGEGEETGEGEDDPPGA